MFRMRNERSIKQIWQANKEKERKGKTKTWDRVIEEIIKKRENVGESYTIVDK